jgi:hypothetical protein
MSPEVLEFVCQPGYYITSHAGRMACAQCPQGKTEISATMGLNEPDSMCYCTAGHYGVSGESCIRCPQVEGFICQEANIRWPRIKPGFYIDYSALPSCIDKDVCGAIAECAFGEKACPGRGNKDCRSDESTCYTGFACTRCCMYFYQSGSDCLPCPDSTLSIIMLVLMAIAIIILALIITSIQTPQLQACIKGMVVMTSFFQGFVSLKFLKIEWPAITLQLFQFMSLFSFSVEGVNPECSFKFDFAQKTIITLLAPFGLAFIVLLISFGFGLYGCRQLTRLLRAKVRELPSELKRRSAEVMLKRFIFHRREAKRRQDFELGKQVGLYPEDEEFQDLKIPAAFVEKLENRNLESELELSKMLLSEATVLSCIKAWLAVVFYKKIEFDPTYNTFWFALCPILLSRLKTRMERSSQENWKLAKSKLKMRNLLSGMRNRMSAAPQPHHDEKLKMYMKLIDRFGLDVWFQRHCDTGRKFISGVASIFVMTYAGSVTSVLSAWNCQQRGDRRFVVLDPETECSADDPKYFTLLIISIFGIIVYCGVLPMAIWMVLTSRWCRRFYTAERAGYESMLGFLTQRYARRNYLWEIVVFFKKFVAAAIPIYFSSSKVTQSVMSLFAYFVYLMAIFKSYPLSTLKLNQVRSMFFQNLAKSLIVILCRRLKFSTICPCS